MADSPSAPSLQGRLLVAEPALRDPNFRRTVVYLIDHSAEGGALGVVVNRPGEVTVRDAIPMWAPYVSDDHVFVGGPVNQGGAICLARASAGTSFAARDDDEATALHPLTPTVGVIDLHADPSDVPSGVGLLRVFGGYAGWSAGQLEGELAAGGWFVVSARDDDVFSAAPERLWRDVLRRQPGELRARAFFPDDPTWN